MQKGTDVRIPLMVNLHIEKFAGGVITRINSGATNVVYDQYKDGTWYVTQRPGMNQIEDASGESAGTRGRGAYYWDDVSSKYIVNAGTVYKGSYAGSSMSITNGVGRVFMYDVGDYLVIIDQENNKGWTISSSAPATITQITDTDFPTEQIPALSLARGGAVLNGKLYVMTTKGDIYESDVEDPTSWGTLAFRNAEVEPDGGVALARHHDHIVALGTRTLEFFQDNANPTGSTLSPRTDIEYEIGATDTDSCAGVGDKLFFVGQDKSGAIGVYMLDDFRLTKVSGEDMDTFLTTAITQDSLGAIGSGFMSGGREFYVLTLYNTITDIVPTVTLVYTTGRQWWGYWDVYLPDVDLFPLASWMPSTNTRAGEGILSNGDLVNVVDDFNPVDTVGASAVYETGVFEAGIYTATGGSGTSITFQIVTGQYDGGSPRTKFSGDLWLNHTPIAANESVDISFADETNATYDTARALYMDDAAARLNRNGSFRKRNFKVDGTLSEQIRMESLQFPARVG